MCKYSEVLKIDGKDIKNQKDEYTSIFSHNLLYCARISTSIVHSWLGHIIKHSHAWKKKKNDTFLA